MVCNAGQLESIVQLDPAQQRFFWDDQRIQVVLWHRQKGKDFATAWKCVMHALSTGQTWYIVSLTQAQADETLAKCKAAAEIIKQVMKIQGEIDYDAEKFAEYDKWLDHKFECKAHTLLLPGGGKVVSLPGRDPRTIAGRTGNIVFTEFGLFPGGGYEHWRTIFPLITRGGQIIAISTPRSKAHKFYELCTAPDKYSLHKCDINQSLAEGGFVLKGPDGEPTDLETFKALYGDDAGWDREYLLKFCGDLEALIKMGILQIACGKKIDFDYLFLNNDSGWQPDFFECEIPKGCRFEIGWDVARTSNLSAVFVFLTRPDGSKQLRKLCAMKNCDFPLQRQVVCAAMDTSRKNVGCGDATGLGRESNEFLKDKYGDRWECVLFSDKNKAAMGSLMATMFSDQSVLLPPMEGETKWIAHDFYAMQKAVTESGKLTLSPTPNALMPDSHCDVAWAGALALRAGGIVTSNPRMTLL